MSVKAFPGQPADLDGNRVECSMCDKLAFTRIGAGFLTIAMVRERLANGEPVGDPRCIAHLHTSVEQIEHEEGAA